MKSKKHQQVGKVDMDNPSNKKRSEPGQRGEYDGAGNYGGGYNDSGYDEEQYMGHKSNKGGKPLPDSNKDIKRKTDSHNNSNHMEEGRFKSDSKDQSKR